MSHAAGASAHGEQPNQVFWCIDEVFVAPEVCDAEAITEAVPGNADLRPGVSSGGEIDGRVADEQRAGGADAVGFGQELQAGRIRLPAERAVAADRLAEIAEQAKTIEYSRGRAHGLVREHRERTVFGELVERVDHARVGTRVVEQVRVVVR